MWILTVSKPLIYGNRIADCGDSGVALVSNSDLHHDNQQLSSQFSQSEQEVSRAMSCLNPFTAKCGQRQISTKFRFLKFWQTNSIMWKYMADSASGQGEANPLFWLAIGAGKIGPSCWSILRWSCKKNVSFWIFHKSFVDQVCFFKMAECWPVLFSVFCWVVLLGKVWCFE